MIALWQTLVTTMFNEKGFFLLGHLPATAADSSGRIMMTGSQVGSGQGVVNSVIFGIG